MATKTNEANGTNKNAYLEMVAQLRSERPETQKIKLFKDNGRYRNDVFVSVNGRSFLLQRGVELELPYAIAQVVKQSIMQDEQAAKLVSRLRGEARFA